MGAIGLRVTVNLSPETAQMLEGTSALASETKTEIINKAVQAYTWIRELQAVGGQILATTPGEDGPTAVTLQ